MPEFLVWKTKSASPAYPKAEIMPDFLDVFGIQR